MLARLIMATFTFVVGLAFATAWHDVWDNLMPSIIAAPGTTSFETTLWSAVPLCVVIASAAVAIGTVLHGSADKGES